MSAQLEITREEIEFLNYIHSRDLFSFAQMKRGLGSQAIEFERRFRGIQELEWQKAEALSQMNEILETLGQPQILRWPEESKGSCDSCGELTRVSLLRSGEAYGCEGSFCATCRKSDEESDWLPTDDLIGMVHDAGDFFFWIPASNDIALHVADKRPGCDLISLPSDRPITANEARELLNDDRTAEFVKLGVSLPEILNCFVGDCLSGIYPEVC